ncbi:MAG TPA: hypothetical protein VMZ73_09840 [Acidimicrobiales bacterium]|nr:hypothetical protein [Acidimicrobiales bacterium]
MEPPDRSPDEEAQAAPGARARPWGPGSPAPGTPVAAFDVGRDEESRLKASKATELYEAARFPDLDEVRPAAGGSTAGAGAGAGGKGGEDVGTGGLRILGVSAPTEIAGPVLAFLALAALAYGWRRRRRHRGH